MRPFARQSVYKIGRVAMVIALGLVSGRVQAQTAPAAPPAPATASTPEVAPVLAPASDALVQGRIDALEQRTHLLEAKLAAASTAPAPLKSTTTFQTDEGGFAITSADRQYQIRFKGLLQVDGRRAFDDAALATTEDTFINRRVRPIVAGTVLGLTDFYIAPDFGNNTIVLIDGYLDTHPSPGCVSGSA